MELRPPVDEQEPDQQNFVVRLKKWEKMFRTSAPDLADHYADIASHELTNLWPYTNEECYFSGTGVYPEYDQRSGTMRYLRGRIDNLKGSSYGLAVLRPEDDRYQVYYAFYLGLESSKSSAEGRDYYALVEADKAAIVPVSEVEAVFQKGNTDHSEAKQSAADLSEYLNSASDDFRALLRSRQFRGMSLGRQRKVVTEFVETTEQASAISGKEISVSADRVLWPRIESEELRFESIPFSGNFFTGTCMGLGSVETSKLAKQAIRRDADIIDREGGLCILVDVETINADIPPERQLVYVPISGQKLEIVFSDGR